MHSGKAGDGKRGVGGRSSLETRESEREKQDFARAARRNSNNMFMDSARAYVFIYPSGGIPELAEDPSLTDAVTK